MRSYLTKQEAFWLLDNAYEFQGLGHVIRRPPIGTWPHLEQWKRKHNVSTAYCFLAAGRAVTKPVKAG